MSDKKMNNNKELAARLMAVQAYYQNLQNKKPVSALIQEYLDRGMVEFQDSDEPVKPHGVLFKKILLNLDKRLIEINEILNVHLGKKEIEPLLKSILLCAVGELLTHQDIDAPLIIDDYLNVTHAFYEKQQVSLVNGVLDKIVSLLRE